jgi:uncharacterized membrane protein
METTNADAPTSGIERRDRREAPTRRGTRGGENVGRTERAVSLGGGAALLLAAARRRDASGALLALAGAALAYRGATGRCPMYQALGVSTSDDGHPHLVQQHGESAVLDASKAIRVEHAVTIARPREELYAFWRDLENLPRIMRHLESVTILDARRSRWKAKAPAGQSVEWDAVINNEEPNVRIGWKSEGNATVPNAGSVRFTDAAGGRGTEVHVTLEYDPPAGKLGQLVAKLFGEEPDVQVREDLQRFKAVMESAHAPADVARTADRGDTTA